MTKHLRLPQPLEELVPGEELPGQHAEAVHISGLSHLPLQQQLRRHVPDAPSTRLKTKWQRQCEGIMPVSGSALLPRVSYSIITWSLPP